MSIALGQFKSYFNQLKDQVEKVQVEEVTFLWFDCLSPLNDWTKLSNQFSHLNLGICQRQDASFL